MVTVGFIDPGNWASNIAAGSSYGYKLLWIVTLATIMLIVLQHNAAHLGIVTGLCISEAINKYMKSIAGIASCITAGMAGGSIFAGLFGEEYDINNRHSKMGVLITIIFALLIIFFIENPFKGLVYSQMLLSIQLPITIFSQIYLTSSKKVMGEYKNTTIENIILWVIGGIVTALNIMLLVSVI